ncbi:cupin domain-containing protein [Devosia sp.]|uniref:cupin domain-containing protein n=1 Tax=Devosia sp. TaxID=1871048 RepID=UPI003A93CABE
MTETPEVGYWHLHVDADGVSRNVRCTISHFALHALGQGAPPQWLGDTFDSQATVLFTVQPPGWVADWHENPKPQWIIPLSGRWFVESMAGERVEMGAGEISFGQDQGCRTIDRKRGHLSGTVGDAPAVLMLVQLPEFTGSGPCSFR